MVIEIHVVTAKYVCYNAGVRTHNEIPQRPETNSAIEHRFHIIDEDNIQKWINSRRVLQTASSKFSPAPIDVVYLCETLHV